MKATETPRRTADDGGIGRRWTDMIDPNVVTGPSSYHLDRCCAVNETRHRIFYNTEWDGELGNQETLDSDIYADSDILTDNFCGLYKLLQTNAGIAS